MSPPRNARRGMHTKIDSSRLEVTARAAEASVAFQSVDDSVWDERYAEEGPLQYGLATLQGPRGEMEDYASIVPRGRCGFLYAGIATSLQRLMFCQWTCTPGGVCVSIVHPVHDAAAIFDGHGGHSAADYMSKNLYKILSVSIEDETHDTECQLGREPLKLQVLVPCLAEH